MIVFDNANIELAAEAAVWAAFANSGQSCCSLKGSMFRKSPKSSQKDNEKDRSAETGRGTTRMFPSTMSSEKQIAIVKIVDAFRKAGEIMTAPANAH